MIDLDSKRLIIFDADGTLRRCTVEGQPCPNRPGEWELMPGVQDRLVALNRGHVAIVSNQGGVGLGLMTPQVAHALLEDLARAVFNKEQVKYCRIYLCPHAPKAGCRCRKPSPLMLYQAMEGASCGPAETLYVGDLESDRQAAQRAGVDFLWAHEFFEWPTHFEATPEPKPPAESLGPVDESLSNPLLRESLNQHLLRSIGRLR